MLKYPSSVGVFLGYAENCPGAVVLDPIANKLSVRRDVVVDENYRFKNVDTNPTLHHINPAKIGPVSYPTDLQPVSIATHTPPPRLLHDTASRYAVDICAGTCSALRFHLEQDPKAKVLAIDILPYHTVVAHIPTHLRARFSYCQMDIRELDISRLQKVLYDTWSIPIDGVDHWHASIPCQTYSVAHHNDNYHRDGLTPITDKARTHDAILEHTMSLVQTIATHNPHTFISLENPLGLWKYMPAVQSCAQLPNWLLLDAVHYCANTSEKDGAFPKKPTSFLFFNVPDTFRLATCNNDCPHRISV